MNDSPPLSPSRLAPLLALGACFLATKLGAVPATPLDAGIGPQLFLDDHIIGQLTGLRRELQTPVRQPTPVLDRETFGTTQHHITAALCGFEIHFDEVADLLTGDVLRFAGRAVKLELNIEQGSFFGFALEPGAARR